MNNIENYLNIYKTTVENILKNFKDNINKIKNDISIFDYIKLNYLNKISPISKLTHLSYDDKNNIIITPVDKNLLKLIEDKLNLENLDFSIINTGKTLILLNQYMNSEKRNKFIKLLKTETESFKILIRNSRRKFLNNIKKENSAILNNKSIKFETTINNITNNYINNIDKLSEIKIKNLKI